MYSLRRRKETGEIWGCRHMVEARHGTQPSLRTPSCLRSLVHEIQIRLNVCYAYLVVEPFT